jgi:hypothetical protein
MDDVVSALASDTLFVQVQDRRRQPYSVRFFFMLLVTTSQLRAGSELAAAQHARQGGNHPGYHPLTWLPGGKGFQGGYQGMKTW